MIGLLAPLFIRDYRNYSDPEVRRRYGMLCGGLGILLNLLLSAGKFLAGTLSGSIAITADALNNLTDASSSAITLIGFRMAGRSSDSEHPFGHGRLEYIAGLIVSLAILMVGLELLKSSIGKIITPTPVAFSLPAAGILLASVCVKLYMLLYNRGVGRKIHSAAMKAVAMDSLSDCVATLLVLTSMLVGHWTGLDVDGYCGVLVALFILYTGGVTARDIITPLLGQPPDPEFVRKVKQLVLAHPEITGVHDLIVHDYGPCNRMISLHAEVPAEEDILVMHDAVDNVENELKREMGCRAVIHMDPVVTNDEQASLVREAIHERLVLWNSKISLHDFRMVPGPTHRNVIFDVVVPYDVRLSELDIQTRVGQLVKEVAIDLVAVVEIDRPYYHE